MTVLNAAVPVPAPRRSWRLRFVLGLGVALVVQSLGGAVVKAAGGRLDDLAHTALHLLVGVLAVLAARRHREADARLFAAVFGAVYLLLAALGWAGSTVVGVLHLEGADHVFHSVVGAASLLVGALPSPVRAHKGTGMSALRWGWWAACTVVGTVIIALPDRDDRLVSFSRGHGPSPLDAVGVLIVLAGWLVLAAALWSGRHHLVGGRRSSAVALSAGFGAGLLVASVMADFAHWWAVGALVLTTLQVGAALAIPGDGRRPPWSG